MKAAGTVRKIIANYEGETPGVKGKLVQMLMNGRLRGSGKMVILPVDQGFEHGPARSFAANHSRDSISCGDRVGRCTPVL